MSVRRLAAEQPAGFSFTPENLDWARGQIAKYPEGRQASAVIPLLWKAQEQHGWLPEPAIRAVADMLGMAYIRVLEVATFYTMFNLQPVGRHFVQVCGTTPCALRGANAIKDVCRSKIGPEKTLSADGTMSWMEVECLGACANAPMVQINYDYYEDLTPENFEKLLDDLAADRPVKTGSQIGRAASCPEGGPTSLTDPALYDGSQVGAWRKRFEPAPAPVTPESAGRPDPEPRAEQKAAESPRDRAVEGKEPVKASDRSAAAEKAPGPSSAGDASKPGTEGGAAPVIAGSTGQSAAQPEETLPQTAASELPLVGDDKKPALLTQARAGGADDLKLIRGVGPKLETVLHGLGVFHFDQIAAWDEDNLRWIDQNLGTFRGRALRDKWIEQAQALAKGDRPADAGKPA